MMRCSARARAGESALRINPEELSIVLSGETMFYASKTRPNHGSDFLLSPSTSYFFFTTYTTQTTMSTTTDKAARRKRFEDVFPVIAEELSQYLKGEGMPKDAVDWYEKVSLSTSSHV
jgi:hypothetical protein